MSDGTPLWKACVPGPGCAAAPDASRRNLYTTLSNGTMVAFHSDNAAVLAPMMNLTVADATDVINGVRAIADGRRGQLDAGDHEPAVARPAA